MRQFRIGHRTLEETAPELQAVLEQGYERRQRPLCLCREPPVRCTFPSRWSDLVNRNAFVGARP
ncbi:DUF1173 family protein [Mesorhizobium sp.]|uniref:DUF1173 family protein n=1 Tax=Mesorhizobium sp. TaxID=1871066 RepID=UPI000FE863D7|nr:DUF1173 family protein [Mesorhizobium sp.]RWK58586.1 MAG: DUF1173 family protein [Mesorhizobium sp.]RWM42880.1 MAG: DUF1173 family protein [Mesorhizobium sp.]